MDFVPSGIMAAPPMATYGEAVPDRNRANQVIQSRLLAEPQYQAVLKLVEKYLPKFDVINMVCALHQCALTARDHEMLKRQIQFDPSFIMLFHSLKKEVIGQVDQLTTRTTSDLLWACARLDIFDSELFNEVITDACRRLEMYSASGISLLVFALGYVGQRPRAVFMQALVRELRSRIEKEFDQQAISMVIYGMMRLGIRDDRLMKIVSEHMIRIGFDHTEPVSLCCLAYAYAKLEYWNDNIFAGLGRALVDGVKDLDPGQLIMASLCFSASSGNLKESHFVMDELLRNAERRLGDFDNRALSTIAFAAGKYYLLKEDVETYKINTGMMGMTFDAQNPFAKEIWQQVKNRTMESFTMTEINLISYALMRMQFRDEDFLEAAADQFVRNAAELQSIEILNALYAFGRMEFVHLQFIHAMVGEIKRRNLMDEMDPLQVATLVYSLGVCHIYEEELLEKAAVYACKKVHEFEPQALSMLLWGMAVLNSTTHAEPLVSATLEDVSFRYDKFDPPTLAVIIWSCSLLSGGTSGIWALKTFFKNDFWKKAWDEQHYTMLYYMFASLRVEEGLGVQDFEGYYMCSRLYEETTGMNMGQQNLRLAERLSLQSIAHRANAMVPPIDGHMEAGVRADIVIEKLKLVIEVEGPQRMTIPLDKTMAEIGDEEVFGKYEDVIGEVRTAVECGLTGSAVHKRRLLRKCGWRVVTVSFDENEEYIADALFHMASDKSKKSGEGESSEEAEGSADAEEASGEAEEAAKEEKEEAQEQAEEEPASPSSSGILTFTDQDTGDNISEYEKKARKQHVLATEELRRRILEERGNAAASAAYSNHLEYRRWQVGLEKEVLRNMVAAL